MASHEENKTDYSFIFKDAEIVWRDPELLDTGICTVRECPKICNAGSDVVISHQSQFEIVKAEDLEPGF